MNTDNINIYFAAYMADVYSQLTCNASEEYQSKYITYTYDSETVNTNLPYFLDCMKKGLSTYKALLFFDDYLNETK